MQRHRFYVMKCIDVRSGWKLDHNNYMKIIIYCKVLTMWNICTPWNEVQCHVLCVVIRWFYTCSWNRDWENKSWERRGRVWRRHQPINERRGVITRRRDGARGGVWSNSGRTRASRRLWRSGATIRGGGTTRRRTSCGFWRGGARGGATIRGGDSTRRGSADWRRQPDSW